MSARGFAHLHACQRNSRRWCHRTRCYSPAMRHERSPPRNGCHRRTKRPRRRCCASSSFPRCRCADGHCRCSRGGWPLVGRCGARPDAVHGRAPQVRHILVVLPGTQYLTRTHAQHGDARREFDACHSRAHAVVHDERPMIFDQDARIFGPEVAIRSRRSRSCGVTTRVVAPRAQAKRATPEDVARFHS
jgi:hypothetical protein